MPPRKEVDAFTLGHRVERACEVKPYTPKPTDPVRRPLRIFALDPSESRLHGNVAKVDVPFEPLLPGPIGAILEVDISEYDADGTLVRAHPALDLEDPKLLLSSGLEPTQSDPRFHAQMVYAVCTTLYQRFREALGRTVAWGFELDGPATDGVRLRIKPLGTREENAFYDPDTGELLFGYYKSDPKLTIGRNLPAGMVFTCLGHDIVAHECTHALLDGLRAHFTTNTHPDVAAFHEGFADIVAILHRFSMKDVIREALRLSRGSLESDRLTAIGRQFGETSGDFAPIRNAIDYEIDEDGVKHWVPYTKLKEPHDRGRSLCAAVYEAFVTIYNRKSERYLRLATNGTGVIDPRAELPNDLLEVLTDVARTLAGQFLNVCIRAIDYCPPVDIRFGDYLRAVITADRDLVPDDPYGYREALIDAFRRRSIFPGDVQNLSEDALVWRGPRRDIPARPSLSFAELAFEGDPGRSAKRSELRRQATEIGKLVTDPEYREEFGLIDPTIRTLKDVVSIDPPVVESVRVARRIGPNSEVLFDLVAEVTQRVVKKHKNRRIEVFGGSTVLIDPLGQVRYIIRKRLLNPEREKELSVFLADEKGLRFWKNEEGLLRPTRAAFRLIHRAKMSKSVAECAVTDAV